MRMLLYILILALTLAVPQKGSDVGKLIPVEVIAVSQSADQLTVRTDTGDRGDGKTLGEAIANLKVTAPGIIYLDTAQYLLVEPGAEDWNELAMHLKGDTMVYYAREGIELEGIANYLSVHKSGCQLKKGPDSGEIPEISEKNGRYLTE